MDQDNGVFLTYCPENADKNAQSLVFKVINNHFNPVMDTKTKQSIAMKLKDTDIISKKKGSEKKR